MPLIATLRHRSTLVGGPLLAAFLGLFALCACATAADKPLKVYILAGQSNMQGHASVSTFDSLADDPKTAPLLKQMRDAEGKPRVCERVWITSVGCQGDAYTDLTEKKGRLTAGFGAPEDKIGPEFTFGISMEEQLDEQILIIKTAWGGRSLHTDFRSPSAGPYEWSEFELAQHKKRGDDLEKVRAEKVEATGMYYREMIAHVQKVLKDIKQVVPDHDSKQGYELAGFIWFQGFNDLVSDWTYPDQMKPGGYDVYAELLTHLIHDVRKDLSAPKLPVVIGVMGIGGEKEGRKAPQMHFREAQRKAASRDEFKGNVVAVETSPFWDDELAAIEEKHNQISQMEYLLRVKDKNAANKDGRMSTDDQIAYLKKYEAELISPAEAALWKRAASNGGYHYLGAAKILAPIGKAFADALGPASTTEEAPDRLPESAEMAGYLLVPHEKVDQKFNGGFSMYVAAWPLLKNYPGEEFQSGLFGTWMFSQHDGPEPKNAYSDIEGGLGWWRDTRFATKTPKFIMGGVAFEFSEWANGPGAGKGRDWKNPAGHYAIAQLSPWVLWPPDGLNLKQGTSGELFGYGYLPLPLTAAKKTTAGKVVPTGNQCWTLFLNTGNFKGPVTFFLPHFWSKPTVDKPELGGLFLDMRPSEPNKAVQMETQHVPAYMGRDANRNTYARVAPTLFPARAGGEAPLIHLITAYSKAALWDGVQAWFDGGKNVSGLIDPKAAAVHTFNGNGGATWEIYPPNARPKDKVPVAWDSFATSVALDDTTYGYRWAKDAVTTDGATVMLPEYFRLAKNDVGEQRWVVVKAKDVPAETGLAKVKFPQKRTAVPEPYVTPDDAASCWKKPGPLAGPFEAKLGDGSVVTYAWYRFADQPAMLNADLTDAEREELQKRVEMLHKSWTKDREYLPPPAVGELADLDPALIVTPPKGLEVGYVPIVTRQALAK